MMLDNRPKVSHTFSPIALTNTTNQAPPQSFRSKNNQNGSKDKEMQPVSHEMQQYSPGDLWAMFFLGLGGGLAIALAAGGLA